MHASITIWDGGVLHPNPNSNPNPTPNPNPNPNPTLAKQYTWLMCGVSSLVSNHSPPLLLQRVGRHDKASRERVL